MRHTIHLKTSEEVKMRLRGGRLMALDGPLPLCVTFQVVFFLIVFFFDSF